MSFGCGVHAMKLNQNGRSSKNSMPHDKASEEFGGKRKSRTSNLDPSRSHLNEYHVPEGAGPRGEGLADWLSQRLALASAERVKNGGRRYSSLTAVGASFTITPDEEAVATWDAATRARFRDDAIESIGVFIGHEPAAWVVHVDEGGIAERGLTRPDELGDQGLHIHVIDPMTDAEGSYRSRDTMSRARIKEMHRVFVDEMRKRGWDMDEHRSAKQREDDGEIVLPGGLSANAHRRMSKWARKQRADAERNFRDAEQNIADAAVLDARAEGVDRAEADAAETRAAAERDAAATRAAAERDAVEGFERPKAVEDYLPRDREPTKGDRDAALIEHIAALATAKRAGTEPPTVHVPGTRELAEQRSALERQAAALRARENALGEREGQVDERERAVERARADVERRERAVGAAEADVERELAGRRAKVRRLDGEIASKGAKARRLDEDIAAKGGESRRLDAVIESKRSEAARLDAEAEETKCWLEGAVNDVKEADAHAERVSRQAERDAEDARRAAEADAGRMRAEAAAEREAARADRRAAAEDRAEARRLLELAGSAYDVVSQGVRALWLAADRAAAEANRFKSALDRDKRPAIVHGLRDVADWLDRPETRSRFAAAVGDAVGGAFAPAREEVRSTGWEPPRGAGRPRDDGPGL